jgi:hypothetical protein
LGMFGCVALNIAIHHFVVTSGCRGACSAGGVSTQEEIMGGWDEKRDCGRGK